MKIFARYILYPIWEAVLGFIAGTAMLIMFTFVMIHIDEIEAMDESERKKQDND